MMAPTSDPVGQAIMDHHEGRMKGTFEVTEHEDGRCSYSGGPAAYFKVFEQWDEVERLAIKHAQGSVLDVGCGAGRSMLHLLAEGHEVEGCDVSPGAIATCKNRGLTNTFIENIHTANPRKTYDTIILFGQNLGLSGKFSLCRNLLNHLRIFTSPGAIILCNSYDMDRDMRFRIWYKHHVSDWIDWCTISETTVRSSALQAGWSVENVFINEKNSNRSYILRRV